MSVGDSVSVDSYQSKWDQVYSREEVDFNSEWHCTTDRVLPLVQPYLHAIRDQGHSAVLDVGCGNSTIGRDLAATLQLSQCIALDISPVCASMLSERFSATRTLPAVVPLLGDCRRIPLAGRTTSLVLEKGTLDALECREDSVRTLQEFGRVLAECGLIISVSFPAVHRLRLLEEELPRLGMKHHVHIAGDGDPAYGHAISFVVCIFHDSAAHIYEPLYSPSSLTTKVLERVATSGSVREDLSDDDEQQKRPFDWQHGNSDDDY